MKIIRQILGSIIVLINFITRPSKLKRTEAEQKEIDEKTKSLSLYQFNACPFCVRVRRAIHKLNLNIQLRDAQNNLEYKQELLKEGGSPKVPCLRIEGNEGVRWMYESLDIIKYLTERFDNQTTE